MQPYRFLTLCAFLLTASSAALAIQECELNGAPINPANGSTTDGKTGLMRCHDQQTGQIQREQELRNGKFMGLVRYYDNGKLKQEYTVNAQGNREGRAQEFSPATGKVISESTYRNSTTIGLSRTFFPDGQPKRITFYDDSGKEVAVVEYTQRGQLRDLRCADKPVFAAVVDEALLCGFGKMGKPAITTLYNDKGELRGRLTYVDGVKTGTETYASNGQLSSQEVSAADGSITERNFDDSGTKRLEIHWLKTERSRQKEAEQEFSDRGTLVRERRWQAGALASEKTFYLNGQMHTQALYTTRDDGSKNGAATSEVKNFLDNGKLSFEGSYALQDRYSQRAIGEHRNYDAEGRLRKVSFHDAKGRLTREQEFDDKGGKTRDDEVFEDGSRKAYAR